MQLITQTLPGGAVLTGWVRAPIDSCPAFDRRPAVLILPGGGYEYCSQRESEPAAMQFLAAGYQAFVLEYSTAEHAANWQPMIDAARAIAYHGDRGDRPGRRVVTLDGMLIDSAGTMAGGGAAQRRGLMRLGNDRRTAGDGGEEVGETAVKKLEAEVARLSRECEEKGRERAELRVRKTAGIEG